MRRTQRPTTTQRQSIQSVNQTNNRFAIEVKTQSKMPKHLGHIPNALSLSLAPPCYLRTANTAKIWQTSSWTKRPECWQFNKPRTTVGALNWCIEALTARTHTYTQTHCAGELCARSREFVLSGRNRRNRQTSPGWQTAASKIPQSIRIRNQNQNPKFHLNWVHPASVLKCSNGGIPTSSSCERKGYSVLRRLKNGVHFLVLLRKFHVISSKNNLPWTWNYQPKILYTHVKYVATDLHILYRLSQKLDLNDRLSIFRNFVNMLVEPMLERALPEVEVFARASRRA